MYNRVDSTQSEFFQTVKRKHKLALAERVVECAQNCVYMAGLKNDKYTRVGNSRLGGLPDLPPGIEWPEEMSFLAQLNLAEMGAYDTNKVLPDSGMLYFFIGLDEPSWDIAHKVIWSQVPTEGLVRAKAPDDYNEVDSDDYEGGDTNVVYNPFELTMKRSLSLPGMHDYKVLTGEDMDDDSYESLLELLSKDDLVVPRANRKIGLHQLLGYPSLCGHDPAVDASARRLGIDSSMYYHNLEELEKEISELENKKKKAKEDLENLKEGRANRAKLSKLGAKLDEFKRDVEEWVLLLELDSDLNAGMMFWDAGHLHYMIRKEDLAKWNFDRTYLDLFSS